MNWQGYLYRTTVRKALELAGRARKQSQHQTPLMGDSSAAKRPDAPLEATELQHKLTRALARLPARQAQVFVLARLEGLSHERIAEISGCTRETVRVHLHRAVRKLARQLREYLQ